MNVSFYGFAILWLSCAIIGLEYYFETATRRREFSSAGCVVLFDFQPGSAHIGEAFHSFCEVFDGFICIAVLDAVAHAVLDVPL